MIVGLLLWFLLVINKRTDEKKETEGRLRTMNKQFQEEIAERYRVQQ